MENNAVSAGVKLGGLFNSTEIRILICYILNAVNEPIPSSILVNELHFEGIANAFEVSDAIVSLADNGNIRLVDKDSDSYEITQKGIETANTLKTSLSYTVKDRAFALTVKMLARMKNIKQTHFDIEYENNIPYIVCTVLDGDLPLMSIKLLLSDENQSTAIKERFLNDPTGIYKIIIDKLTK